MPTIAIRAVIAPRPFYEKLGYRLLTFEARQNGSTFLMRKRLAP